MIQKAIESAVEETVEFLIAEFRDEIEEQGHNLTGRLSKELEGRVTSAANSVIGTILIEEYGEFVNRGVRAGNIPFSGRTGRGGTSAYIQGLIRFFNLRGVSGSDAVRAAFATANIHRREGMPSRGSYRFSRNGYRKGFIDHRLDENKLVAKFEQIAVDIVSVRLENYFSERLNV